MAEQRLRIGDVECFRYVLSGFVHEADRRTLVHAEDVRDLAQAQVLIVVESNHQLLALWEPGYGLCDLISRGRTGETGPPAIRCKCQRLRLDPSRRNMSCEFRNSAV